MIVIDASATIALLLNENAAFQTSRQIDDLSEQPLVAPSHWAAEVGNSLVINVRRRRLAQTEIDQMIERLSRLGIQIEPSPRFEEIAAIAHQAVDTGLTYYDAAYLHTAQSRRASLFTLDRKMRDAAARLNITLFEW